MLTAPVDAGARSVSNSYKQLNLSRFLFRVPVCIFLAVVCASCSSTSGGQSEGPSYEYISRQDQVLREVMSTPTQFTVDSLNSRTTWKRANIFMKQYALDPEPRIKYIGSTTKELESMENKTDFSYRIRSSRMRNEDEQFVVLCYDKRSGKQSAASKRAAHNLARFLISGQLERNFL